MSSSEAEMREVMVGDGYVEITLNKQTGKEDDVEDKGDEEALEIHNRFILRVQN